MAKKNNSHEKHTQLAISKLESSGLTVEDAKKLQIQPLSGPATAKLHKSFKPLCSLCLTYLDPYGKPLSDWPASEPFFRLRYLESPADFSSLTEKKPLRYTQAPNTAPVAYYPSLVDWAPILKDVEQPLILTEGELKAAKACKEGFPTIGLGGVYNWRSFKIGLSWLPSLDFVSWTRRHVYICFDSDFRTNPMVCAALRELAEELHRKGSFVYLVSLPQLEGLEKVGLDDFLVHAGASAEKQLTQLLHEAEPLGLTSCLWDYNDRYVYVRNPGIIVAQESGQTIAASAFKEHLEATQNYQERQLKQDGSVSYKAVSAAAAWLRWPLRQEAATMTYSPGKPRFIVNGTNQYNLWPGWGVEPKKGDVEPFIQLIDHLFTGAEPGAKEWFLRWCAFPLQYPGVKMFSSALIYGVGHGTGKSLVGYSLGAIYGKNFTEIDQDDLHGAFNSWAEAKQFVMGDDIAGSDRRADQGILRKLITQKQLRVNKKFVPDYTVPDFINYYFTANYPDAFFLEDNDRRHFIQEVLVGPLPEEFYIEYSLWLDTGGAAAIFHYLLNLDLGDFNPAAPAFVTLAKKRMISDSQSDLGGWIRDMLANPDQQLRIGDVVLSQDLLTSKELLLCYDPEGKTRTTANGLGRELRRAGAHQVLGGKPVRLSDGSQARYYAVRNCDRWAGEKSMAAVAEYLDARLASGTKRKYK